MIWYLKHASFLYRCVAIIGVGLILYAGNSFGPGITGIIASNCAVVALFAWILVCLVVTRSFTKKYYKKIMDILVEECDPEKFINLYLPLAKKKTKKNYMIFLNPLITAYNAADRGEEVVNLLKDQESYPANKVNYNNKVMYYNNMVSYYCIIGDLSKAGTALMYMKWVIDHSKLKKNIRNTYANIYIFNRCHLNIAQGVYDGNEDILNRILGNSTAKLTKISAEYLLGLIYTHRQEKEKAKTAFEFIVENGNKIALVEKARNYLNNQNLTTD